MLRGSQEGCESKNQIAFCESYEKGFYVFIDN